MKFMLIGGEGYIGRVLQQEIKSSGHEFISFDSNLYGLINEQKPNTIIANASDSTLLDKYNDYDIIVNLASVVGEGACLVNPKFSLENNILSTMNVVKKAKRDKKKLIHVSTCSIYGSGKFFNKSEFTEDDFSFPIDFYGILKYHQERMVKHFLNDYAILRLGTVYGVSPRMRYDLVINRFVAMAKNNKKITVFGGDQYRPFVHIRDVARAIIFSAEKNLNGIYNVSNENLTIIEVAERISKIIRNSKIEINNNIIDKRNYIVSSKKIRKRGFEFIYDIDYGIREILNDKTIDDFENKIYNNKKLMEDVFK